MFRWRLVPYSPVQKHFHPFSSIFLHISSFSSELTAAELLPSCGRQLPLKKQRNCRFLSRFWGVQSVSGVKFLRKGSRNAPQATLKSLTRVEGAILDVALSPTWRVTLPMSQTRTHVSKETFLSFSSTISKCFYHCTELIQHPTKILRKHLFCPSN